MPPPSFIAPSSPLDRRQLGKYEVLCRLSTGGMSAIYLAHQKGMAGFKKLVVLKTILPDIGGESCLHQAGHRRLGDQQERRCRHASTRQKSYAARRLPRTEPETLERVPAVRGW